MSVVSENGISANLKGGLNQISEKFIWYASYKEISLTFYFAML